LGVTRDLKASSYTNFFHNQSQLVAQLQMANNTLKDHAIDAQNDVKATLSVAQAILANMLTGGHSSQSTKAAEPESFNGSRDKTKQYLSCPPGSHYAD